MSTKSNTNLATLLSALAAAALMAAASPAARAGDLGDGSYDAPAYGNHRPYYSGQDTYAYAGDTGDDDDDDDAYDDEDYNGNDNDNDYRNRDDDDDDDRNRADYDRRFDRSSPGYSSRDGEVAPPPHRDADRRGCVSGDQVKRRLIARGWSRFQLSGHNQTMAVVRAVRVRTGRAYELRLDGCTGRTLSARPLEPRRLNRRYGARD